MSGSVCLRAVVSLPARVVPERASWCVAVRARACVCAVRRVHLGTHAYREPGSPGLDFPPPSQETPVVCTISQFPFRFSGGSG